jgi:membrane-bound inhibitor of C-type lysozyme
LDGFKFARFARKMGRPEAGNPECAGKRGARRSCHKMSYGKHIAASRTAVTVVVGLVAFGASLAAARAEDPISTVNYVCKGDKTIKAVYYSEKVDLTLSDGRSLSLPQTMSGSGIRYANADESVVFWSKGNTAFITEGADAQPTFDGCKG